MTRSGTFDNSYFLQIFQTMSVSNIQNKKFGWAIVGTGLMGHLFTTDLLAFDAENSEVVAICTRVKDNGKKLANDVWFSIFYSIS